jgi:hypothetical protein
MKKQIREQSNVETLKTYSIEMIKDDRANNNTLNLTGRLLLYIKMMG